MPKVLPLREVVYKYLTENFDSIENKKNLIGFKWENILPCISNNLFILDSNNKYTNHDIVYVRKIFERIRRKFVKEGKLTKAKIGRKSKFTEEEKKSNSKLYFKEYAKNNKETLRVNRNKYVANNLEKNREHKKKYYKNNKEKVSKSIKEWKNNNKEVIKQTNKEFNLRVNYGLTIEDYNNIFNSQNGCCAICNRHQMNFKKNLAVDHDHNTGEVRGLLCHNCNTGLGQFKDNIELMKSGIDYLNKYLK